MDVHLDELLQTANRLEDMTTLVQWSEAAKLHLRNAIYLIRLTVQREEENRRDAQ